LYPFIALRRAAIAALLSIHQDVSGHVP
jgi:hypothetical protein